MALKKAFIQTIVLKFNFNLRFYSRILGYF